MSRIHTGLQSAKFSVPNTVTTATICAETGKKAKTGCTNTYQEYFLWLTVPGICNKHSGSEVGNSTNYTNNVTPSNNTNTIIQGITEDIDAVDPQEMLPKDSLEKETSGNETTSSRQ